MSALHLFEGCGVELEYMLVARDSLDVLPIADKVLQRLAGSDMPVRDAPRGELGWSNELVLHVTELKNVAPTSDLRSLTQRFQDEVVAMNKVLQGFGAQLMPGGMHPWMDPKRDTRIWPHGNSSVYQAYNRIFGCSGHGWSNLQSTHVNLPFATDAEFARLHAALRLILPILPALAAASPYAEGRAAEWLDYRMEVYRHNADALPAINGEIVPEPALSRDDYERRILDPIYRAIAPLDPDGVLRREWLNARGAIARFERNAIEVRVLDTQECPLVDVAIAALLMDLAAELCETRLMHPTHDNQMSTRALGQIFIGCIHDADRARIDDADYLRLLGLKQSKCDAGSVWWQIAERLDGRGSRYSGFWRAPLEFALARGPLARRLLRAVGPRPDRAALHELYGALSEALNAGKPFDP